LELKKLNLLRKEKEPLKRGSSKKVFGRKQVIIIGLSGTYVRQKSAGKKLPILKEVLFSFDLCQLGK